MFPASQDDAGTQVFWEFKNKLAHLVHALEFCPFKQ